MKAAKLRTRRKRLLGAAALAGALLAVVIAIAACSRVGSYSDLDATYNARQCIYDKESRSAGLYTAEYGGSPGGSDGSTASGAAQWLNGSWQSVLPRAEAFYDMDLTSPEEDWAGARYHAAYASPYVQDLVTAFALVHPDLNDGQHPWSGADRPCYQLIGSPPVLRDDGTVNPPTPWVQKQIDDFLASITPPTTVPPPPTPAPVPTPAPTPPPTTRPPRPPKPHTMTTVATKDQFAIVG